MLRRSLFTLLAGAILAACSGNPGTDSPNRQRDLISPEEIAELNVSTAYDVVRQLRPEYLRSRGTMSLREAGGEYAVVYLNGMRLGGLDQLNSIRATDVQMIRYISASDATTRWGTGHTGGVIEVVVKS